MPQNCLNFQMTTAQLQKLYVLEHWSVAIYIQNVLLINRKCSYFGKIYFKKIKDHEEMHSLFSVLMLVLNALVGETSNIIVHNHAARRLSAANLTKLLVKLIFD
jgi:hypothetical protein